MFTTLYQNESDILFAMQLDQISFQHYGYKKNPTKTYNTFHDQTGEITLKPHVLRTEKWQHKRLLQLLSVSDQALASTTTI